MPDRPAAGAPTTEPTSAATESDADFIARLERLGRDWRYSDEFIGLVVRNRFPREWPAAARVSS
jgi:hypothetical protein